MRSFSSSLFKRFPEGRIKNLIRCFFYNKFQCDFRIKYNNGLFLVEKGGIKMHFFDNPYHQLLSDRDYFHHYTLQAGDVLVDAGAFRGILSIYASRLVGDKGFVIALEPDPDQYNRLMKNIEVNSVRNIRVIKKGLWSENTVLSFRSGKELASSFFNTSENEATVNVEVTTIDEIFKELAIPGSLLIKMNIEGSEIEALKGAKDTIRKYNPGFVIRTNHLVGGKLTDGRVEELLRNYGYKPVTKMMYERTTFA